MFGACEENKKRNMEVPRVKNKLKMSNNGRYYGAYLIYDVANSCFAALHSKEPAATIQRPRQPSPVHAQNPRKSFSEHFLFVK